jgi:hypothetical protein
MRFAAHHDATVGLVRTTVSLDDDVAAEVARLRRELGVGLSEAVNRLARAGLSTTQPSVVYEHRSVDLGAKVDVTNVGEVLDLLDEH